MARVGPVPGKHLNVFDYLANSRSQPLHYCDRLVMFLVAFHSACKHHHILWPCDSAHVHFCPADPTQLGMVYSDLKCGTVSRRPMIGFLC